MKRGKLKVVGEVVSFLTDKNGNEHGRKVQHNTISDQFYEILSDTLFKNQPGYDITISPLFYNDEYAISEEGYSGIVDNYVPGEGGGGGSPCRCFTSVASQPAANQFRVTGTYTNNSGSPITMADVALGKSFIKAQGWEALGDGGYFNGYELATGGMADTTVPDGDTLTVVWTITFTVH